MEVIIVPVIINQAFLIIALLVFSSTISVSSFWDNCLWIDFKLFHPKKVITSEQNDNVKKLILKMCLISMTFPNSSTKLSKPSQVELYKHLFSPIILIIFSHNMQWNTLLMINSGLMLYNYFELL